MLTRDQVTAAMKEGSERGAYLEVPRCPNCGADNMERRILRKDKRIISHKCLVCRFEMRMIWTEAELEDKDEGARVQIDALNEILRQEGIG